MHTCLADIVRKRERERGRETEGEVQWREGERERVRGFLLDRDRGQLAKSKGKWKTIHIGMTFY